MNLFRTILGTTLIAFGSLATTNIAVAGSHEKMQGKGLWSCQKGYRLYKNDANQFRCLTRALPGWRISNQQNLRNGKGIPGMQQQGMSMQRNNGMAQKCQSGFRLYKNDANQFRCLRKQLIGWRPVQNQQNGERKLNDFGDVVWRVQDGRRVPSCKNRGYQAFYKGGKYRCFGKAPQGWKLWNVGLRPGNGIMKVQWQNKGGQRFAVCPRGYKAFHNKPKNQYGCFKRRPQGWINVLSLKQGNGEGGNGLRMGGGGKYKYDNFRWYRNGNAGCSQGKPVYDSKFILHCN